MKAGLEINNLTVSYNGVPAIRKLSVTLSGGECAALLGPNGAGKSTLIKAIAGLIPSVSGSIQTHGGSIAYVPQRESVDWDFPITVRGLAEMGRYSILGPWRRFRKIDREIVDSAIAAVNLEKLQGRQIRSLSGGQQQRAFLARAISQEAAIYLLDEPFTGLDQAASNGFARTLKSISDEGKLVIASHHNLNNVKQIFSQAILLNGELLVDGATEDVISSGLLSTAFGTEPWTANEYE